MSNFNNTLKNPLSFWTKTVFLYLIWDSKLKKRLYAWNSMKLDLLELLSEIVENYSKLGYFVNQQDTFLSNLIRQNV